MGARFHQLPRCLGPNACVRAGDNIGLVSEILSERLGATVKNFAGHQRTLGFRNKTWP